MQSLFFWRNWLKEYKIIWYALTFIFLTSLLFLWYANFKGADNIIDWQKLQEQKVIETTVHSYRSGPFELSVPAESFVIFEYFHGSDIVPNTTASYFFLSILTVCIVLLLTIITTLEKLWYFIGMALFILFMVSLRLEVLGIFGYYNRLPVIITLMMFVLPSFYFNRLHAVTPFVIRLLTFLFVTVLLGITIAFFASVPLPFYHLTLTGYTPALIISVIFMIMIAHDILGSFVYIVSQGTNRSLRHLSIISAIYFINILIACFHELGVINWNFIYINLYLLLSVSAIIGLWGFKHRESTYGNIFAFQPFGAFLFISIGSICFATIAQLLGNANDPALKIIRDLIIFTHAGYGLIFITYLFSNFVLMLARNIPVYKVLYNPTRMPYFTYQLAGLIVTLAFVFYSNWREYIYHGLAGFYNSAGDLYAMQDNNVYAESFYEQGKSQGFQNHRSNYALGSLKAQRFNFKGAHYNYDLANAKRPTEFSLTNAGNTYLWENNIFNAITAYQKALTVMPASGILANNLGFAYAKVHNLDSAVVYFNEAREDATSRTSAETNFFAMAAQELLPLNADSILKVFNTSSTATLSNALALSTLFKGPFSASIDPLAEKKLNLHTATLLNNYIIKNVKSIDTTFINQAYKFASDSINADFSEAIKASLAFAFYHQGNVTKALSILGELAYISQTYQGRFNYIMGLWALEQRNPNLAASYFSFADTYDYKQAQLYNAIALTEAMKTSDALAAWDTVASKRDEAHVLMAAQIKKILTTPIAEATSLNDADKYQFCRYNLKLADSLILNQLLNTFSNDNYKAQTLLETSQRFLEADELIPAIVYYRKTAGLEISDKKLLENLKHFELLLLAQRGEIRLIANQINKGVTFDASRSLEKMLYTALIAEASGDTVLAEKNYKILASYNPYFEEGIINAANYYRNRNSRNLSAYNILAEAIQVNANSIRLLKAYIAEAARLGFDEYAKSAAQRLAEIK